VAHVRDTGEASRGADMVTGVGHHQFGVDATCGRLTTYQGDGKVGRAARRHRRCRFRRTRPGRPARGRGVPRRGSAVGWGVRHRARCRAARWRRDR
jgi:hypothetical protein